MYFEDKELENYILFKFFEVEELGFLILGYGCFNFIVFFGFCLRDMGWLVYESVWGKWLCII